MHGKVFFDDVIHEKSRFLILGFLLKENELSFNELKELTGLTEGNLASHLRMLEDNKIIEVKKDFAGRRPKTTYKFTPSGKKKFIAYLEMLKEFLIEISKEEE